MVSLYQNPPLRRMALCCHHVIVTHGRAVMTSCRTLTSRTTRRFYALIRAAMRSHSDIESTFRRRRRRCRTISLPIFMSGPSTRSLQRQRVHVDRRTCIYIPADQPQPIAVYDCHYVCFLLNMKYLCYLWMGAKLKIKIQKACLTNVLICLYNCACDCHVRA